MRSALENINAILERGRNGPVEPPCTSGAPRRDRSDRRGVGVTLSPPHPFQGVDSKMNGRRSRHRWALWALVALTAVGCSSSPVEPEQDALTLARARWAAAGVVVSYSFEFQRLCFCSFDTTRGTRVEVVDGSVDRVVYVDTGDPVSDLIRAPTVGGLFDEIQDAIDRQAHSLMASYDSELGHPTDVAIDFLEFAVDEEMSFMVSAFEVLAGPLN